MSQIPTQTSPVLVTDIGGTNARFACLDLSENQWLGQWTAPAKEFDTIEAAVEAARAQLPQMREVRAVCIAIAAPVREDWVKVSNGDWAFSPAELKRRFGWPQLTVMNDFHAAAYGAVDLTPGQYTSIGRSNPENRKRPSAVVGPGTGLGVAGLYPGDDTAPWRSWWALATEGGHARFAPADAEEVAVLEVLRKQLGVVQREDILSGPGLVNLYRALARVHDVPASPVERPADITARALADGNSHAATTLTRFCAILGTVAADVALNLGTRGTVYMAGGILPRIAEFFLSSPFRQRFDDHARFGHYLHAIDTVLVTEARLGLIGAAYWLRKQLKAR